MNKIGQITWKDLFELGLPALLVFATILLIHSSYWPLGLLGMGICFLFWIKGDKKVWGSLATAFFVSGLAEFGFSNIFFGATWIIFAIGVFLIPRW